MRYEAPTTTKEAANLIAEEKGDIIKLKDHFTRQKKKGKLAFSQAEQICW